MLTDIEKKIIAAIQGDMAITKQPYLDMAKQLGMTEDLLLKTIAALCDKGVIRRFGATLRHQKSGYSSNAMVAWQVDEDRIDEAGEIMASFKAVSHCYRRRSATQWPYNLYTMVDARDRQSCLAAAEKISEAASVATYAVLFSQKELKKTSMTYF